MDTSNSSGYRGAYYYRLAITIGAALFFIFLFATCVCNRDHVRHAFYIVPRNLTHCLFLSIFLFIAINHLLSTFLPLYQCLLEQVDFEWAVKLNRFSLRVIGLWPKSEYNVREISIYNIRPLMIVLFLIINVLIPSIHSLLKIRTNIMLLIDNLQFTLPAISCAIRIIIFWWKKEAIIWVLNMVAEDWLKFKSVQERDTMIRRAQIARIIITCAYGTMMIVFIFIGVLPICGISMRYLTNDSERLLPLQTYHVYNVMKSPQYELTFAFQIVSMFFAVLSYTGIDNFLGLVVFHICGQLEILRNRIEHLNKFIDFHDILKKNVEDHTRLLKAIDVIEDIYNIMLLILFLYFGILFACYGFLVISLIEKNNDMSISHLVYQVCIVINTFGHMCLYCAVGEILVIQCDRIHYAVYNYKWYSLDPRNAKGLILLMIKSSKPIYLTAGKMFPMTMATFCNLIKTSASYISVLLTTKS